MLTEAVYGAREAVRSAVSRPGPAATTTAIVTTTTMHSAYVMIMTTLMFAMPMMTTLPEALRVNAPWN